MVKLVTNAIIKHKDLHRCLSSNYFFMIASKIIWPGITCKIKKKELSIMKKRNVHISADYIFQNAYPWWREKIENWN